MSVQGENSVNGSGCESAVPVAVIGTACRLAGSATDPNALWQMLSRGKSGWSRSAGTRFNLAAFHHPSATINGSFNAQGVHLLKQDVSHFDNQMFNISAVEAKAIDPQQRLLLEVSYEAFENAGIPRDSLDASETGVYCAVFNHDYESIQARDPEISPSYRFTGTGHALVSNRISYVFDLRGPSMTIDTACSGSLVAVHQACQAIRIGEIRQALVGGTNLILDPEYMTAMSSMKVLSDHGRCYAFDNRAEGFGRGEGVAAIVLKRLDDALRDGDPIRGIIRGSAINQDGRTPGVTMPSHAAQIDVINKAYAQAGLNPKDTCYVEAHGTGTQVGDKIEAGAIAESFGSERTQDSPLYMGSVKTNIGHTESTAGLAGLLKALLVLEKGVIPPNINFAVANEAIPLEKWNIKVPLKLIPWPVNQIRRASVNSFGYGGSNAHVILDCAEEYLTFNNLKRTGTAQDGVKLQAHAIMNGTDNTLLTNASHRQHLEHQNANAPNGNSNQNAETRKLFILTHNTNEGVGKLATNLKRYATQYDAEKVPFLDHLAHTLNSRRSPLAFRVPVTASSREELIGAFDDISKGIIRPVLAAEAPKICQGAQWACMGRELMSTFPVYAKAMEAAEHNLIGLGAKWKLREELNKPTEQSRINDARLSQPCCTAIQIALVDLLLSWDIRPQAVCGHSSGEIAAAYAAGFLTASDALKISFFRGEAVNLLPSLAPHLKGAMLAVGLSAQEVQRYMRNDSLGAELTREKIVIACINSPKSVTMSGDLSQVKDLQRRLDSDNVFNRMLVVDVAYHSHHMDLVKSHYLSEMKDLQPCTKPSGVTMISSVTGKPIGPRDLDASYWAQNMVSCVLFTDALEKAVQLPGIAGQSLTNTVDAVVEIGPHSALAGPIKQSLKAFNASKVGYHSTIVRNVDGAKSVMEMAGGLACSGLRVNFNAINDPAQSVSKETLPDLPTYNWHHTMSHWSEGRSSSQYRFRKFPRHDLLGVLCDDSNPLEPKWRNYIRIAEAPWLRGHAFQGNIVVPASAYICSVLEAVRQVTVSSGRMWKDMVCRFRQIHCEKALLISEESTGIETLLSLRPYTYSAQESSSSWKEFRIFSLSAEGETTEHCRGLVSTEQQILGGSASEQLENPARKNPSSHISEISKSHQRFVNPRRFYGDLKSIGVEYTGAFANITKISASSRNALCTISVPETKSSMPGMFEQPHCLHPATLDMCFHAPFVCLRASGDMKSPLVISHIEELNISSDINTAPATSFVAHVSAEPFGAMKSKAMVAVADNTDAARPPVIDIKGLLYTRTLESSPEASRPQGEYFCHQIKWDMDVASANAEGLGRLCQDQSSDDCATRRRDAYDKYAQKVIQTVTSSITAEDEARMEEHHKKLLKWMWAHKSKSYVDGEGDSRDIIQSLGVDGQMLVRVGDHMMEILRGKADALTILLEEDLLYKVYSNENTHRCHEQLAQYIRLLQFKNPGMDVLEIGAGTAGTTVPTLEALSTWSDDQVKRMNVKKYVFTDISSGFFEKSKEKLNAWQDILEFQKLDIEGDIDKQGFSGRTFDLIIASNVLHATHNIAHTLRNVRRLLKPGGKLILVEITQPHMTWPMIVGTLPGWWLGTEDGRVDSPSLNSSGWDKVLQSTNFTGVDVEMKDYISEYEHQMSVLIATATPEALFSRQPSINIVSNEGENPLAAALTKLLSLNKDIVSVKRTSLDEFKVSDDIYVVLLEHTLPFISQCDSEAFDNVKKMLTRAKNVLWVTRGATIECNDPERAMITGLARTARSEDHLLHLVTLDLDPADPILESAKHMTTVLKEFLYSDRHDAFLPEFEYAVRDGALLIPRIIEEESLDDYVNTTNATTIPLVQPLHQKGRSLELRIRTPGLLETFYWADSITHSQKPGPGEVRIRVDAIPLNFKDLMTSMGQLDGLTAVLIECGGVIEEVGDAVGNHFKIGDKVCAVGFKSFATTSNVDHRLVQHVPEEMSLEVAAAIQISYATALYALRDVAKLQKGESVLIHSAAGGFGQAAIAIAKYLEAGQIYVTVGSAEKRKFLTEKFGIPDEHMFSSRNTSFKDGLLRRTKGNGVDVILNSLIGDAMLESHSCLARFGRFVEIGKKDLLSNTRLEMRHFEQNVSFSAVDLSLLMEFKPSAIQELLSTAFDLIRKGKLELLGPITKKNISELEPAFRLMQTGKHIGKIVMTLDDTAEYKVKRPQPIPPKLREDGSYLFIGGTGGLGKVIIRHLAKVGARHIITMSRSGAGDDDTMAFLAECRSLGLEVTIQKGSVLNTKDILQTVKLAGNRPIRGVIQGAMVLEDSTLNNMTYKQWQAAVLPKVQGTLNLQSVFGESLEFFILLSSGTGIIGSFGQGNYCAGNTFQDAFARWRTSRGLPARTIDLGPVEGEGYAAENENALEFTIRQGMGVVKLEEVVALINHAITYPYAKDVSCSQTLAATRRADPASGSDEAAVQRPDPKFVHLWAGSSKTDIKSADSGEFDFRDALRSATTHNVAIEAAQTAIVIKLSKLLAMPIEDIRPERAVGTYGMDSLISVELRNWMAVQLEANIQQFELMAAKSIQELAAMAAERSRLVSNAVWLAVK
ncbi:hypothetical protein BP6252_14065 [Coleophoma cylindrospora]|uniref:Uncharacterized protein n=1 Tax=Coleophoma cylindrospora TaxID=1849047 RepID=A0A3D8Q4A5_9HELO|nr:hypothetical protein BP6252_14065 [Coleophoma cylindrospora]